MKNQESAYLKGLRLIGQRCLLQESIFYIWQRSFTEEISAIWVPKNDLHNHNRLLTCQAGGRNFTRPHLDMKMYRESTQSHSKLLDCQVFTTFLSPEPKVQKYLQMSPLELGSKLCILVVIFHSGLCLFLTEISWWEVKTVLFWA